MVTRRQPPRPTALVMGAMGALLVGCAGAGERGADAADAASAFERSLGVRDAAAVCAALAPSTRQELEGTEKAACDESFPFEDVRPAGRTRTVDVYGRQARVILTSDTLFLSQFDGGWKVVAAGCRPQSGQPYDCTVKGR